MICENTLVYSLIYLYISKQLSGRLYSLKINIILPNNKTAFTITLENTNEHIVS